MVLLGILGGLACVMSLGAVLFGSAGRLDLGWFWAYLGVWAASAVIGPIAMDADLIKERVRPGPGGEDYVGALVFILIGIGQHAVAGLDVGRYHWSDSVPLVLQMVALMTIAAALAVAMWAMTVNRFFSSVIRIQTDRGHRLITSGPYAYVRHPAYAAGPFVVVGSGLALGSWTAALLGLVLIVPMLRRTAHEDQMLRQHLEGYAAYAEEVRYRLLPHVW